MVLKPYGNFFCAHMNKILLVVVLVVAVGGFLFYTSSKGPAPLETPADTKSASPLGKLSGQAFSGTLAELVSQKGFLKCSFRKTENGSEVSGTTYVSGGRIRTDYSVNVPAVKQTFEGHMIYNGDSAYTWTSVMPNQGFKVKISSIAELAPKSTLGNTQNQSLNIMAANDYTCSPWAPDATVFNIPGDITFTDYSSLAPKK